MSWAKIDDGFLDHPKALEAGEDAANLYLRALVYCRKHLTDGRVPKAALRILTSKPDALEHVAALLRVGLWDENESAWNVHDYLDWNDSAAQVRAASDRKSSYLKKYRRKTANQKRTEFEPGSSRVAQPSANSAQPNPTLYKEEGVPPTVGTGRVKKDTPEPLPFKPDHALALIAVRSGGRFPRVEVRDIDKGQAIALGRHIRRYPDPADWELVGEWLASGELGYRTDLSVGWAASSGLSDAMASARAWRDRGKQSAARIGPGAVRRLEAPAAPVTYQSAEEARAADANLKPTLSQQRLWAQLEKESA